LSPPPATRRCPGGGPAPGSGRTTAPPGGPQRTPHRLKGPVRPPSLIDRRPLFPATAASPGGLCAAGGPDRPDGTAEPVPATVTWPPTASRCVCQVGSESSREPP